MRRAARIVGVVWMVACAILWLWVGLVWDFDPLATWPTLSNWSVISLLADSKLGLTFVPILLGGVGFVIFRWGADAPATPQQV